ncbi:MAG: nicotinate-nucleotide adenylyltransferase [Actinobacteria bacterium]|nr:MAG: nicotinate-nucleotide adenylyltransferase [Actinomycetota bacterium]
MSVGEAAGRRLGVFGGTFDPVHVGHLVAAVNARHALGLDRVLLVVANQPWQKHARAVTPAPDRFAVVEAAVTNMEGLEASAVEVERGGPSYTADTLDELSRRYPDAELFLVIGADVADELDSWERMEAVRELATLVVVNRPGVRPTKPLSGWKAVSVEIPGLDISSTDLRARAANGRPLDFLVPEPAVRLIRQRGLYAGGR